MAIEYLKRAARRRRPRSGNAREVGSAMLAEIERAAKRPCASTRATLDRWPGEIVVSPRRDRAAHRATFRRGVSATSISRPRKCAASRTRSASRSANFRSNCNRGLIAGQRLIPVNVAGCYVPTGRYAHIASAYMASRRRKPRACRRHRLLDAVPGRRIHPHVLYAMNVAGADVDHDARRRAGDRSHGLRIVHRQAGRHRRRTRQQVRRRSEAAAVRQGRHRCVRGALRGRDHCRRQRRPGASSRPISSGRPSMATNRRRG